MELRFRRPEGIEQLRPLIVALGDELGPEFERSMRAWFGLAPRPYALEDWQVLVVEDAGSGRELGICGYYRHQDDLPGRYWVGWLGVLPAARRRGVGAQMLARLARETRNCGATELWVYTEPDNHAAIAFYGANGWQPRGRFADLGLPQAAASADSITFAKSVA